MLPMAVSPMAEKITLGSCGLMEVPWMNDLAGLKQLVIVVLTTAPRLVEYGNPHEGNLLPQYGCQSMVAGYARC